MTSFEKREWDGGAELACPNVWVCEHTAVARYKKGGKYQAQIHHFQPMSKLCLV